VSTFRRWPPVVAQKCWRTSRGPWEVDWRLSTTTGGTWGSGTVLGPKPLDSAWRRGGPGQSFYQNPKAQRKKACSPLPSVLATTKRGVFAAILRSDVGECADGRSAGQALIPMQDSAADTERG
jgi:hypothetical protein